MNTKEIVKIVGPENVVTTHERVAAFLPSLEDDREAAAGFEVVTPQKVEHLEKLLPWCDREGVKVHTTYDFELPAAAAEHGGVILDFSRMNAIERIDKKNLTAHVQRGVTYEDLKGALDAQGLSMFTPVAGTSPSVACSYARRDVLKGCNRDPEVHVSNMLVVLADGRVHKTGSHSLSEEGADLKEDPGPNLSRWYLGSEDTYGVMVRASVMLYPKFDSKKAVVASWDDESAMAGAMREIAVRQLGWEVIAMNRRSLAAHLEGAKASGEWTLVLGCEGMDELVEYYTTQAAKIAQEHGGRLEPDLEGPALSALSEPWRRPRRFNSACFTTFGRVGELDKAVERVLPGNGVARTRVAYAFGAGLYATWFPPEADDELDEKVGLSLVEAGGFIDRPSGQVAQAVYSKMPAEARLSAKVKTMMDPRGTLNPGYFQ